MRRFRKGDEKKRYGILSAEWLPNIRGEGHLQKQEKALTSSLNLGEIAIWMASQTTTIS